MFDNMNSTSTDYTTPTGLKEALGFSRRRIAVGLVSAWLMAAM
jgi:hypothetical protein